MTKAKGRYPPPIIASYGDWGVLSIHPEYRPEYDVGTQRDERSAESQAARGSIVEPMLESTKAASEEEDSEQEDFTDDDSEFSMTWTEDENGLTDVSRVYLDGVDTDSVPVFMTAVDVREGLMDLLERQVVTETDLCPTLSSASNTHLTVEQLCYFLARAKLGDWAAASVDGVHSPVFYAGYVYMEKLRLLLGDEKTPKRLEMERVWGAKGIDRRYYAGYHPWYGRMFGDYDEFGRLRIINATTHSTYTFASSSSDCIWH